MVKISIIMPSKNVGGYIKECLTSVINQTLKDIEIICIDALSTDGTREILEYYANKDRRIQIVDDVVGSTGYAFNTALKLASGKYIGIVETDDYVENNMFEILYHFAEEYRLDYVKADFNAFMEIRGKRFFVSTPTFFNEDRHYYNKIITPREYKNIRIADGYMWKGIYRSSFLKENYVTMHETMGAAFQDQGFLYRTIYSAERVMYLNQYLYNYRRDNENSSIYSSDMVTKMMREYHEIEKDIQSGALSIKGCEEEFFFEKFARYKGVLLNSHPDFWEESMIQIKKEFYEPFLKGYITKNSGYVYEELILLLNSVSGYMKYLAYENLKFQDRIREIVDFVGDQNVVVCCAGVIAEGLFCLLERFSKGRVVAVTDNNKNIWGQSKKGICVMPTAELNPLQDHKYIVANERNAHSIYAQLNSIGIAHEDIYICDKAIDLNRIMDKDLEINFKMHPGYEFI